MSTALVLKDIAIDIAPCMVFANETTDFVQAVRFSIEFITSDKFYDGVVSVGLQMPFYRQSEPVRGRGLCQFQ